MDELRLCCPQMSCKGILALLVISFINPSAAQESANPYEGAAFARMHREQPITDEACTQLTSNFGFGIETMPYQKYRALEVCVAQYLKDQFAKQENNLTLDEIPPLRTANDRMTFNVKNFILPFVDFYSGMQSTGGFFIGGSFDISWTDPRLRWPTDKWRLRMLRLAENDNDVVWLPTIAREQDAATPGYDEYTSFAEINVTSEGVVSARYAFQFNEENNCVHDVENFPRDAFSCCTSLVSKEFVSQIRFSVAENYIKLPPTQVTEEWQLKSISAKVRSRDNGGQSIDMCVTGFRTDAAIRIELVIPMAIAGIVCLIAPIAPSVKKQLNIKLFGLLLQFLCFEFAFYGRSYLIRATGVPRLFRFYEFTIAVTIASLILTFLVMLFMSCKQGRVPLPRRVVGIATVIVNVPVGMRPPEKSKVAMMTSDDPESESGSWPAIVVAFNNLVSFILSVIYVIGIIVITA